jgi:hypothetical protein
MINKIQYIPWLFTKIFEFNLHKNEIIKNNTASFEEKYICLFEIKCI